MQQSAQSLRATQFAQVLAHEFGHDASFEFDLMGFEYQDVKAVLETYGFSVHRAEGNWNAAVAIRVEPDLQPVRDRMYDTVSAR